MSSRTENVQRVADLMCKIVREALEKTISDEPQWPSVGDSFCGYEVTGIDKDAGTIAVAIPRSNTMAEFVIDLDKYNANESRMLVTEACKTPPHGTPPRGWQNALMALEEHARTRGWAVQPTDVEIMREVIAAYERAR